MNKLFPMQSDHPLFRYFTEEERRRTEAIGDLRTIDRDAYLIRAGGSDASLFAVEDGHLDIVALRGDTEVVVATVGPGDVLGEVSFIDDSPRTVSVRAGEHAATVRVGTSGRCRSRSRSILNCWRSSPSPCPSSSSSAFAIPRVGCRRARVSS